MPPASYGTDRTSTSDPSHTEFRNGDLYHLEFDADRIR
jgi:hypothetical protein